MDQRQVAARLRTAGVAAADAEAGWLVDHVRGEAAGSPRLAELVRRREQGEPLQLLLGRWPFRGVELELRPGVFLPRPETEVVAGVAVELARAAAASPMIAEPCTGTGAIAASLLTELPGATVHATDLDPAAVGLARANLARLADPRRWHVHHGDLLAPLPVALRGRLDLVVANPPYLPTSDRARLSVEVADHDPALALYGGEQGHEVVDRLLALAAVWLRPGGGVVLEIDARLGADAARAAHTVGLEAVEVRPDLTGRDRVLVARRPGMTR